MPLQFTITDSATGIPTIIDEPVGMDKVSLHLSAMKPITDFSMQ